MTYNKKLHPVRVSLSALVALFLIGNPLYSMGKKEKEAEAMEEQQVWVHNGFEGFSKGQFDNAGGNLYVNADGVIEMINNLDVNSDGYVDLVLANSHDRIERGPTWAYSTDQGPGENWPGPVRRWSPTMSGIGFITAEATNGTEPRSWNHRFGLKKRTRSVWRRCDLTALSDCTPTQRGAQSSPSRFASKANNFK